MKKKKTATTLDPEWKAIATAQSQAMQAFDKLMRRSLTPILGASAVKQVTNDIAITTSMRRAVIVHAPLSVRGRFTLERIRREKPMVSVLATMVPLRDPVTLQTLPPGVYAVGMRSIGRGDVAFDFYAERDRPALSSQARIGGPPDTNIFGFDIDITLPDKDSLRPPPNGEFCLSILHWYKCWDWDWPEIDW